MCSFGVTQRDNSLFTDFFLLLVFRVFCFKFKIFFERWPLCFADQVVTKAAYSG